jgi:PAS domain S-box-containing protein
VVDGHASREQDAEPRPGSHPAEEAASDPTMLEGSSHPIEYDGQRLFSVGVAAPLQVATAYSRIVQHCVVSLLRERALAWSEERFRDVAESAGDWIWEMNNELRFTYLSPRFFEIFRVPRGSIIGKTRAEFAGTHVVSQAWQDHEAKLAARLPFRDFAYSTSTPGGQPRHIEINGKPVYDPKGEFIGYRGTGSDTEQVQVERALKRTEQLLSDAIETIPEGFSLYDKADRLVMFNSKYRTLLYPDQDVEIAAGMTFEAIVRQAAASGTIQGAHGRVDDWVRKCLALRRDQREPHIQQRGEGKWIRVSEPKTADGGTVALYSDITELKQRERELADKTNALEQLARSGGT